MQKLELVSNKIGQGIYDEKINYKSRDEIGRLSKSFDNMRQDIKNFTENLQEIVQERTLELSRKNQDIQCILQNLHQGIFILLEDCIVHHEYSAYLEEIFQTKDIAGRRMVDLLFGQSTISKNDINQVIASLDSSLGEHEINYDANDHLLPTEIHKTIPNSSELQILEVDWQPIVEDDYVTKVMVIVKDVTEYRKLQVEADKKSKQLEIINQILDSSIDSFEAFAVSFQKIMTETRAIILAETPSISNLELIFRNMHTIKGNSRMYGYCFLADAVHEAEESYSEMQKHFEGSWNSQIMLDHLESVELQLAEYLEVFKARIGDKISGDDQSKKILTQCISLLPKISAQDISQPAVVELIEIVQNYDSSTLKDIISPILNSIPSIARELHKPPPAVHIIDNGIRIRNKYCSLLNDVFVHCIRNSLDHGIETPDERLKKEKDIQGNIHFRLKKTEDQVIIHYLDDGKGLNLPNLAKKAKNSKVKDNDQDIANLIFQSGVSTAEKVTSISGRGVGMDAVKSFLKEQKADISIQFTSERNSAGFRTVEFIISLPLSFIVMREDKIVQIA